MVSLRKTTKPSGGFRLTSLLPIPRGSRAARTIVTGLDIQPGYVAAASSRVNGRVVVERAAFAPLDADTMREGEVVSVENLANALRSIFNDTDLPRRVRIGIANQRTVMRVLEVPPLEDRKELEAAVRFQAEDQLPMPLANAAIDFRPLGIVDTPSGPRQRVLVVAAQLETVEKLLAAARSAGLRAEGIDLAAFALVRALSHRTVAADGQGLHRQALLNVGGLSNLVVAEGLDCRFTRVLSKGLESIAQEIAERRSLPIDRARELLFTVGAGDQRREEFSGGAGSLAPLGEHAPYQDAETLALQMEQARLANEQAVASEQGQAAGEAAAEPGVDATAAFAQTPPSAAEPTGFQSVGEVAGFGAEGSVEQFAGQSEDPFAGQAPSGEAAFAQPAGPPPAEQSPAGGFGEPKGGVEGVAPADQPTAVGNTAIGHIEDTASTQQPTVSAEAAETQLLVEAGIRSIAGEVRNTLDFYAAQEPGAPFSELVLCGPALDVPGFAVLLERYLGLPVRGELVGTAPGAIDGTSANLFAVAAGLSLEEVKL